MNKLFSLLAISVLGITGAKADVVNGGFETGDFTGWSMTGTCTAVGSINPVCMSLDSDPGPHSGSYAAYLGSANGGTLSQMVATDPGAEYVLSFFLANTSIGGESTPNSINVSWNGTSVYSASNLAAFGYTEFTFTNLLATGPNTLLEFDTMQGPADFVLDDVHVNAVPEPASWLFLAGGLGLMSLLSKKAALQK